MSGTSTKTRSDYTEGSIIGSILGMGLPSMFGFISQNIYGLVDTFWVARLENGESAVAAVTFFGTIMWLFFSFNQLIGPGSVAIISRRYGEKEYDRAETAIKETLALKLFFGLLMGGLGLIFLSDMLYLMGARDIALEQGIAYGRVMFMGIGIMYATYSIYTAMRGIANPNMSMWLMISSNILNMILDPIFIYGFAFIPAMGIEGAAVASVVSFTITFGVGMYLLSSDYTNVKLHWVSKVPMSINSMWKIVKIGIPAWLGSMSFSSARLVITPLIATFGTSVVAAYGVGNQVTHFGIAILVGIGLGLGSLIGHNIGGKKYDRARKTGDQAIMLGVGIMTVFGIVSFFFARPIMGMFFDSPETIEYGVTMFRIMAIGFPFMGLFMMVEEIHMGVGMNTPGMIANIVHAWPMEVLLIFLFTQHFGFGVESIWWIITLSGSVTAAAFYLYYRGGKWLTAEV